MATAGAGGVFCRRNSKLDSFLKRNTERGVYARIRAYEPCVVVSESVNRVFMHVVLSDDCVYLTQYPPRTLTPAVGFRDIRDIELVNDLPEFLSGRDRERSQHIRVAYAAAKPSGKKDRLLNREPHLLSVPSPRQPWLISQSRESAGGTLLSTRSQADSDTWNVSPVTMRNCREEKEEEEEEEAVFIPRTTRSASCPNPETLGLRLTLPPPLPPSPEPSPRSSLSSLSHPRVASSSATGGRIQRYPEVPVMPRRRGSALARLLKSERVVEESNGEGEAKEGVEREAELHLYAVSPVSRIYLHLQSSWNSYIIRSTLLLDPLYRSRRSVTLNTSPPKQNPISWERTAQLYHQLSAELLQEDISLEGLYLLLQELCTAAHRDITLRKLFWRSGDMFPFLVQRLEDSLQSSQRERATNTADSLLLGTLIAQTLALMFRETEIEPTRLSMLTAKQGAQTARLLLALVCDPELQSQSQGSTGSSPDVSRQTSPPHTQGLLEEYLDAACSLLFELVLLCQEASRTPSEEHYLTVGWILRILQPHPSLLSFVGYQARQVVVVLSGSQDPLSPCQAALLYQRCKVLLACLKYGPHLSQHLRTEYGEEFRYIVKLDYAEEKLPLHYPISQPALRLISQLLGLMLQKS